MIKIKFMLPIFLLFIGCLKSQTITSELNLSEYENIIIDDVKLVSLKNSHASGAILDSVSMGEIILKEVYTIPDLRKVYTSNDVNIYEYLSDGDEGYLLKAIRLTVINSYIKVKNQEFKVGQDISNFIFLDKKTSNSGSFSVFFSVGNADETVYIKINSVNIITELGYDSF